MKASIIYDKPTIDTTLNLSLDLNLSFQVLFNQGKYTTSVTLIDVDEDYLYFDFSPLEETSIMNLVDIYIPSIFIFFVHGFRYQFLSKNQSLVTINKKTILKALKPSFMNLTQGRMNPRFFVPENISKLEIVHQKQSYFFKLRDISLGGFSIFSDECSLFTPNHQIKAIFTLNQQTFHCLAQIIRVQYVFSLNKESTDYKHIISFKFINLNDKQKSIILDFSTNLPGNNIFN